MPVFPTQLQYITKNHRLLQRQKKKKREALKWFYFFSPFNFKLSLELHSFFSKAWSKAHWIQRKDSSASISWEKAHNTPYAKYESIHLSLIHILLLLCALQQGISFLRDEACKGVAGGISKQRFLSTWAPRSAGAHPPSQQCYWVSDSIWCSPPQLCRDRAEHCNLQAQASFGFWAANKFITHGYFTASESQTKISVTFVHRDRGLRSRAVWQPSGSLHWYHW